MKKHLNVLNYLFSAKKETTKKKNWMLIVVTISIVFPFASCQKETTNSGKDTNSTQTNKNAATTHEASFKVFATGLNNPRGLKFGPDGNLYVAEAGLGGTNSTIGICTQVVFPVGPYTGSATGGRISKITPDGVRSTVTDQLPSSQANEIIGGDVEGVADIEFVGNNLYALLAGGGCSHGVPSVPNGIVKVNSNGGWSMVTDLSNWLQSHPPASPAIQDFEPDGTWYSMINVRGDLYALEPNTQQIVRVDPATGTTSLVIDLSKTYPGTTEWFGPTAIAYHGNFFIGNLDQFPIEGGASQILKMTPDATTKVWETGLNTVLGLVFDNKDRMYVLEMTVGAPFPTPGLGRIVRIDPGGSRTVIATGLNLPTGMTMGPDGNLYVSNWGFGPPARGGGQVLQISLAH